MRVGQSVFSISALVLVFVLQTAGSGFAFKYAFQKTSGKGASGLQCVRILEPREQAFSMLAPKGWLMEGGMFRVNAAQAGGPLNAIEAKCDLTIQKDSQGTVVFRIYPDIVYAHEGIGGGFFPPGQYYQGAQVRRMLDASNFLSWLFQSLHPQAASTRILKVTSLPGEKKSLDRGLSYLNQLLSAIGLQGFQFQSDAAAMLVDYDDGGRRFREILMTGIVNMPAAMTWKNTRTLIFRAPVAEFERWSPLLDIMRFSVQFSRQWFLKEAGGQQQRAEIARKVYEEIRRLDREIVRNTTINREEIMNDNFLVLTEQEEFVNPHTGKVEVDTDHYRYRWKTNGGDVYYTNNEDENPNLFLQRTDYELTPVRKR